MKAVVCGSFAYDNILSFEKAFKDHLIATELDNINVSFLCDSLRREFGGCAGNIIYNCSLINCNAIALGTLGKDAQPYLDWMKKNNIITNFIKVIEDSYTAQAYITTDNQSNQITTFHPGAMQYSNQLIIPDDQSIVLGLISPDGRNGMLEHTKQLIDMKIPYVFDPGQGMPMFNRDELIFFSDNANWIIMNDYEFKLYNEVTGINYKDITQQGKILIVTKGKDGSVIYDKENIHNIPTKKISDAKDPTGCGDAYRAGLIYGIMNKMPIEKIGELSSALGALKVSHYGTQNHILSNEIKKLL